MGVDAAHRRIDRVDPLEHSRHGRAGRARHVQGRSGGGEIEGGVDALLVDRVPSGRDRGVAVEVELSAGDTFHSVDGARLSAGSPTMAASMRRGTGSTSASEYVSRKRQPNAIARSAIT